MENIFQFLKKIAKRNTEYNEQYTMFIKRSCKKIEHFLKPNKCFKVFTVSFKSDFNIFIAWAKMQKSYRYHKNENFSRWYQEINDFLLLRQQEVPFNFNWINQYEVEIEMF